jgi:Sulfatase
MTADNILVLAVDGLRAAALGAYGNTTFPTPALDQLAAESLVCDWCFADGVSLPDCYRALWPTANGAIKSLAARGWSTALVTDEPQILQFDGAADFEHHVQLPAGDAVRAADVSQTAVARLFAAVSEEIEKNAGRPRFLWVHSRGMFGPWDAPLEWQEELLAREEGDPSPADVIEPPNLWIDRANDPDAAFRWSCAYAAQVMAFDACLDGLLQTVNDASPGEWLVVLLGVRGFGLGEHGRVGDGERSLFGEQLHVPLVWRFPGGERKLARSSQLLTLADVAPAILSWSLGEFCLATHEAVSAHDTAGSRAIRSADWSLRVELAPEEHVATREFAPQLFVRPDDRWEANDVAALCSEAVESLLAKLDQSHSERSVGP